VQHMRVQQEVPRCIRLLAHAYVPAHQRLVHPYLRGAKRLRPDWSYHH